MSTRRRTWWLALALMVAFVAVGLAAQGGRAGTAAGARGVKLITAADMKEPMRFLGAREFRGRPAPSVELDIASRYIALEAERIGLKPLMPNGSYFQDLPVEVTTMSSARSQLRVFGPAGDLRLSFPQSFTTSIRTGGEWSAVGGLVFAGTALNGTEPKWDDAIDLRGRWVVLLEPHRRRAPIAPSAGTTPAATAAAARTRLLREKGAIGTITVISREREDNLAKQGLTFDVGERLRWLDVDTVNPAPPAGPAPSRRPGAPAQGRPRRRRSTPSRFATTPPRQSSASPPTRSAGTSTAAAGESAGAAACAAGPLARRRRAVRDAPAGRRRMSSRICRAATRSSRTSTS